MNGGSGGGSSPLARGLRNRLIGGELSLGIIPARAGFTSLFCRRRSPCRDHPRSRGVYWVVLSTPSACDGSSPLARGLLACLLDTLGLPGIIPARAGFTFCTPGMFSRTRDHPRSRGVYLMLMMSPLSPWGSSPLARGLLSRPARCQRYRLDHPRSRGVYRGKRDNVVRNHGSSPLARGLLSATWSIICLSRIIPARAGFTEVAGGGTNSTKDHPRSRGVYPRHFQILRRMSGSSPLARGLPWSEGECFT